MKKIALIPSYEPGLELLQVVNELVENHFSIVVVNDGSGEKFNEIFDQLPSSVHYLKYGTNQGKGHALKHGFSYIKENFDEDSIIVTLDSDGQHRVLDAIKISDVCEKETNTLILGSRMFKNAPIKSKIGNFLARTTFLISTRHKIYDTQTGLRAFRFSMLDMLIKSKGERYEYETNVLLDAVRYNITIKEVSIETIYINNNSNTHYSPFKDTYKILREVVKFSASSLIGFLIDYLAFTCLTLIPVPESWIYWNPIACNIIARIISASVNFTINYKLVFRSKKKLWKAILEYVALALFILGCNTLFLYLLVDLAGMNEYLAKVIVEVVMFTVSWIVQRLLVFRKRRSKK